MKKFLKSTEASKYLGVSRSSLSNWVRQGLLGGGSTPGGHYRFTRDELDKFAGKRGLQIPAATDRDDNTRILVIDDDKAFREYIREALDVFEDFDLREVADGMEGALLIGSWKPDLVIVDLRMPRMNGIEFCRLMKKDESTEEIDIIVASAYLSDDARKDLKKLGVEIVFEKPVRLASLVAAIEKCTGLKLK